jgi:hypothetical protein
MKSAISKAIDPARVGLSKSTIVAASLCQRKAWYGERIRDAAGRRISVPMPERVLFGVALDNAVQHMLWNVREGLEFTYELLDEAVLEGLAAMDGRPGSEELDADAVREELEEALGRLFTEAIPNLPPITKGVMLFQGMDGESLRFHDLIGTPDILCLAPHAAIIDVKSSPRRKSERDLMSPEMAHYATMYLELFGQLPVVGYLTWVRSYSTRGWQFISMRATPAHVTLAHEYRTATRAVVDTPKVATLGFNAQFCGSCEWKQARPELGFMGCEVGQSVEKLEVRADE